MNLTNHQVIILDKLVNGNGTGNVMEILNWNSVQFDESFVIANEMQNLNLVKLLYCNFNKNLVVVELTLFGESEYNKNQ